MIRHLDAARADGNAARSVDIELELLEEATTETLEAKIAEFQPAVVHIIAHGRWDDDNEPRIILSKRDEPAGVTREDPCSPLRLINAIGGAVGAPPIVVLSACHTGEPNDSYLPYAAGLVNNGVAVALGMAGEVADHACRIFTRAFYQSLLEHTNVAEAVAKARRAAMLHYKNYDHNVEWGRPILFMRDGQQPIFTVDRRRQIIAMAAFKYRPNSNPAILCDRLAALNAYQRFRDRVRGGDYRVALAFEVIDDTTTVQAPAGQVFQIGKSRLLDEIAARAVLDGFVPCLLRSGGGFQAPANLLRFAIRLAEVMDDVRGRFVDPNNVALVAQRRESFSLSLAAGLAGRPLVADLSSPAGRFKFTADKTALVKQIEEGGDTLGVSRGDILDVISEDVSKLLDDINAAVAPGGMPAFHSLLIMIDDLHIYEGLASELVTAIVDTGLAGQHGRAATVFTYSTRAGRGAELLGLIKAKRSYCEFC